MRLSEPLRERPACDVLLTVHAATGSVEVAARCYAVVPPHIYLHPSDPRLVHDLPPRSPVLLTAGPEQSADWQFLDAAWGFLERVDDRELAPHGPHSSSKDPLWRVRLHGGGRAAIEWNAGRRGDA